MNTPSFLRSLIGAAAIAAAVPASALDLTGATTSGTVNGAFFTVTDNQSTGTGVIDPFVRLQDNGIADGYNTSARPLVYDELSSIFTRDLQLSAVPIVNLSGTNYYEFLLDINQTAANPLLSLDVIKIFTASSGGLTGPISSFSTLRYSLDGAGDAEVLLDYSRNNGSGSGDLFAYIPTSVFGATTDYVYFYSMFGAKGGAYAENDGFEEWSVRTLTPAIPEPETYALMLAGLAAVGFMARRRRQV